MIEILTPTPTTSLETLSAIKALAGIAAGDDSQDVGLTGMIAAASEAIADYTGRDFPRQRYRETLSGLGFGELILAKTPIESVSIVTIDGETITDFVVDDFAAGILWRDQTSGIARPWGQSGWPWSARAGGQLETRPVPATERHEIQVTYWAGYLMPGADAVTGSLPLPAPVRRAAWEIIRDWRAADERNPSIASRTALQATKDRGAVTISSHAESTSRASGIPPVAMALLRTYRL